MLFPRLAAVMAWQWRSGTEGSETFAGTSSPGLSSFTATGDQRRVNNFINDAASSLLFKGITFNLYFLLRTAFEELPFTVVVVSHCFPNLSLLILQGCSPGSGCFRHGKKPA